MADEKKRSSRHSVTMEDRERITITGVKDVLSFDEEGILVDTEQGMLLLRGANLHVGRLDVVEGHVSVDGMVDSLEYSEGGQFAKGKGSFLGRIFK